MTEEQTPWKQRAKTLIAMTTVLAAGLCLTGTAFGQGHMRITEDDLPGGQSSGDGGLIHTTIEYIKNNTYVNIGPHYLDYVGSSKNLTIQNATGLAATAFTPGCSGCDAELENTGAGVGNKTFAGGTLGIYVPGTGRHLAMEVLLAAPLELTFETRGRATDESLAEYILGSTPTDVPPVGKTVGTLMTLPPNLTVVYRPWVDTLIQPYIGLGVVYLYTYDTDVTNDVLTQNNNEPTLYLSKPVGCMGQLGVDVQLPHSFYINADARYIGCAEVDVKLNDVEVVAPNQAALPPARIDTISTTVDFEALIYSLNIGVKF